MALDGWCLGSLISERQIHRFKYGSILLSGVWTRVRDSVDVAIEFSQGHYSGRSVQRPAQRLFGQDVFPVCSPELLDGKNPLTTPDDLRGHTLIHFDAPMDDPGWPNWETWLRANNVDRLDPNKGPHFTSPNFTTQALLAGHGVALMAELVVESELATGTLVKPFDISYPGDLSYWALALQSTVRTIL
ncbi:MAG: hypothetical protein CM1200mP18_02970 [Gammaproteobacteria bacterium]|nr:MAG: hypothetical protein CM1200mP18_02970 [Gammaproteobacteria bacterium]